MDWFKKFMLALFPEKAAQIEQIELPKDIAIPADKKNDPTANNQNAGSLETQELKSLLQSVLDENKQLKETLGELKSRSDSSVQAMEERAKTEAKAKREALIAEAIKAQKIPAKSEDLQKHYLSLLEANFDSGKAIIDSLPVIGAPAPNQQPGNQGQGGQQQKAVNPILATILEKGNIIN